MTWSDTHEEHNRILKVSRHVDESYEARLVEQAKDGVSYRKAAILHSFERNRSRSDKERE